jgi:hypothetical protein
MDDAIRDIQSGIDWYEAQQVGLGNSFFDALHQHLSTLTTMPHFQIRYAQTVRCLPVNKFPYMIHYTVDDKAKTVIIRAVFNTFRDPSTWKTPQ